MKHETIYQSLNGSVYLVGDIHGQYSKLMRRLDAVRFDFEKDVLVCTGDLIDKGPESIQCLELLNHDWFASVKGNHEAFAEMIWSAVIDGAPRTRIDALFGMWYQENNGGEWFKELTSNEKEYCLTAGLDSISRMPIGITVAYASSLRVGVVHARPPSLRWDDQSIEHLTEDDAWRVMTSRELAQSELATHVQGVDAVCVGHSVLNERGDFNGNLFHIDTGAWKREHDFLIVNETQLRRHIAKNQHVPEQSTETYNTDAPIRRLF